MPNPIDIKVNVTDLPKLKKVIEAWIVPGSHPGAHEAAKNTVRRNWPTLGNALDELVEGL